MFGLFSLTVTWVPIFWAVPLPSVRFECPADMVRVENNVCIDRLPWPNREDEEPLLGVSASFENYVPIPKGETWDCESLCGSRGRRICRIPEWQTACMGTPISKCGEKRTYIAPKWDLVASRNPDELERLDQHADVSDYPECMGHSGARMMTTLQEWVRKRDGSYALTRSYWSREGDCTAINTTHAGAWHDYATACRCCLDAPAQFTFESFPYEP